MTFLDYVNYVISQLKAPVSLGTLNRAVWLATKMYKEKTGKLPYKKARVLWKVNAFGPYSKQINNFVETQDTRDIKPEISWEFNPNDPFDAHLVPFNTNDYPTKFRTVMGPIMQQINRYDAQELSDLTLQLFKKTITEAIFTMFNNTKELNLLLSHLKQLNGINIKRTDDRRIENMITF